MAEILPEEERRRDEVEHLHQALRQEPGIAGEEPQFLCPERGRRTAEGVEAPSASVLRLPFRDACGRYDPRGEGGCIDRDRQAENAEPDRKKRHERQEIAHHRARRPPQETVTPGAEAINAASLMSEKR